MMINMWNFATPRVEGTACKQVGVAIPKGLWERYVTRDGFFGPMTAFYHRNPPTAYSEVDDLLRMRLLDVSLHDAASNSPWDAAELLYNSDVRFRFWRTSSAMDHLVRNADGDELLFVHRGGGELYCDYGHISLEEGDYLVLPRGCMWRFEPAGETQMLLTESSNAPYRLPEVSLLGKYSPFDPGVFGVPQINDQFEAQRGKGDWTIRVKLGNRIGAITYPYNPLDAEGWKGDLYPIRLNVRDIRPLMSHRSHVVPSIHTTFLSDRFVVCTFVPKPGETDPESCKLPGFHNNVDYSEIMFMHSGGTARHRGGLFHEGMLTYHPPGITHGPHPNVFPLFQSTEPLALTSTFVMIDTRSPLELGAAAAACDVPEYGISWRDSIKYAQDAQ